MKRFNKKVLVAMALAVLMVIAVAFIASGGTNLLIEGDKLKYYNGSAWYTITPPAVTGTLATTGGTETLTGKTLTSPTINGGSVSATTSILDTSDANALISNGTKFVSVAISGDATIANTGALTIGNNKIGAAETNYTVESILIASGNASNTTTVTSGAIILGFYPVDAIDNAGAIVNSVGISGTTLTLKTVNNVSADTNYKVVVLEP